MGIWINIILELQIVFGVLFFDDHELLKDIEANDCYNLPNLTRLIQKIKQDERLVNKQTGIMEPWNWSPETSVSRDTLI